jgi:cell division transport system permease protein
MIIFYLKETFRIFRKSSLATAITISITTIAIILSTISLFLLFTVTGFSDQIKKTIEVNVYLDDSLGARNIESIKNKLENESSVLSVKFINKEDAIKKFLEESGQDFRSVLDQNPLPNSFIVKFNPEQLNEKNIEQYVASFRKIDGVSEVIYDYRTVLKVLNSLKSFEYVIYILSITLILLSIYLVYSNNKMQIFGNKNIYVTMKLVGAEIKTMKIPLLLNGVLIGLIAFVISIVFFQLVVVLLTKVYNNIKFINQIQLLNFVIPVIGITLGFMGSFISSYKISKILDEN